MFGLVELCRDDPIGLSDLGVPHSEAHRIDREREQADEDDSEHDDGDCGLGQADARVGTKHLQTMGHAPGSGAGCSDHSFTHPVLTQPGPAVAAP